MHILCGCSISKITHWLSLFNQEIISSDTIQNMFSTLVKNLTKEVQVIFCE